MVYTLRTDTGRKIVFFARNTDFKSGWQSDCRWNLYSINTFVLAIHLKIYCSPELSGYETTPNYVGKIDTIEECALLCLDEPDCNSVEYGSMTGQNPSGNQGYDSKGGRENECILNWRSKFDMDSTTPCHWDTYAVMWVTPESDVTTTVIQECASYEEGENKNGLTLEDCRDM
eukprot:UN30698